MEKTSPEQLLRRRRHVMAVVEARVVYAIETGGEPDTRDLEKLRQHEEAIKALSAEVESPA